MVVEAGTGPIVFDGLIGTSDRFHHKASFL